MIKSLKKTLLKVQQEIMSILFFIAIVSIGIYLFHEDIFEQFTPIRKSMHDNQKVMNLHFYSDLVSTISSLVIGLYFFVLYSKFKDKPVPLKGLMWMLGLCCMSGVMLFGMDCLGVYYYFPWIEGTLKLITAVFFLSSAISMAKLVPILKQIKTPEEYLQLSERLEALNETYKELKQKLNS